MHINGTHIDISNTTITIDGEYEYVIEPNIICDSWVLHNSNRYDLIKYNQGWESNIYNYLITNKNKPNIPLIALLLTLKRV